MFRILLLFTFLTFLAFSGKATDIYQSDTILIKRNDLPALLKSQNYIGKTNFINQQNSHHYVSSLKSYSQNIELDSIVVSEWSEESGKIEKSYLYLCNFENEGKNVAVNIFYWDTEKIKWRINDENYYEFDENNRLKRVEFQEYYLPNYQWYTRIDYEYENGLLKFENRYDRIDEIEFWEEIEQYEYIYNDNNSLKVVHINKWDILENDWVTNAYREFAYDSIGYLTTETGFDYNFYDVESTKKYEVQYSYSDNNNLVEIVKYVPGWDKAIFEPERKQENFYNVSSELNTEIFYDWDYDLKIWLRDVKKLYFNEAQGPKIFEEISYSWNDLNLNWEGSNKIEYLSEYNYFSEDIQNWEFLQIYMPAFSFNGVVCDKIENTIWENDKWLFLSTTNYYFTEGVSVGIETEYDLDIRMYPNPVANMLTIRTNNLFETTCRICDLNGRIINQTNFQNDIQIDVSYLLSGIYLVELYSEDERIYVDKIIKN
ncbi:T9SS type A sorting domain-containing protein [Prolixibacteraceae bacterium Z1-6]|uniref:T9SS type A sorting domain-containing protein n=1 Tax=Draconibacterium aestuarii TaxID=2998507 RepID=A0A9X3FA78_9BACT|nr:T9SS type A sorting domain-containing protein [Prolixibacteraceae bacterium Z1-6]